MPFEFWPHLIEVMNHLDGVRYANGKQPDPDDKRHLIDMKSRQIGLSWLMSAYTLWCCITKESFHALLFSKGEKECWELLGKVKSMWINLPEFLKLKLKKDSAEELSFENGSWAKAYAATESAGVGEAGSLVVYDEMEYHPSPDISFQNVKPTIDSSGGQMVIIFTVDKKRPETFTKSMFKQAYYDGVGEFKALFQPYTARPGRDEEWYANTMISTPSRELQGLSPELYMQQNYPRNVEEALAPVQTIAAFDLNILDAMKEDCRPTLDLREKYPEVNFKLCSIYKDFQVGKTYVAATDTGHGVGKDYSVTAIMDLRTNEIVADIVSNKMSVEDFTYQSVKLLGVFRNPKWFPEDNDWGADTIRVGMQLGYKNFGYYDTKKKKIGFHSNDSTRTDIWGRLMAAINNRQVVIYSTQGLSQFYDIYWNTDHNPTRLEAMPGRNDDYPTTVGILLWAADKVPLVKQSFAPIRTLTFA